jgi:hypothetical protein
VFVLANATIKLFLPKKLLKEIKKFKEIKLEKEISEFLEKKVQELKLAKLEEITKNSKLTDKDIEELGAKIKKGIAKWHNERT